MADIALVHHLPPAGGAWRVIAEYVAHRPQHRFTVYTRQPAPEVELVALHGDVTTVRRPLPEAATPLGRLRDLRRVPGTGRALAAEVDAGGHDAVFVHSSTLVQSHEVLPFLRTRSVAYAPEALRSAYEPPVDFGPPPSLRDRLVRANLDPYERHRRALDRRHIRAAQRVVTHSRFTAGELQRIYGVDADVVPLGVAADDFARLEGERARRVLSVGALHPLKGHQFVIEALATVPADRRPPLTVIGDRGELAAALEELARERGVELELLQAIPFADLLAEYHGAGVMACGQIREPFGLITLEAMAAGLPVVAVAEGGLAETVDPGLTGLLTERDPAAFGAALMRVLDDPALAGELRAGGLRAARERWTWDRAAERFDTLLGV